MTALHETIGSAIETAILAGELRPGDRLPVEHELMDRYGCSRMTVSKALSRLVASGMIERRRGAGSFVAAPRVYSMVLDIPDLAQQIEARGQAYSFDLVQRREAHDQLPELGGIRHWLEIEGVHKADGRPLAHEWRAINLMAVPDALSADFAVQPPGAWLLAHVPWTEAETRIAAAHPAASIARHLQVDPRAACLQVERRTWRGDERITLVRQHFLGDSYDLVARFGPNGRSTR